jgi:hypothetical protein
MGQSGTWDDPGGPTMPPQHMVAQAKPGRTVAWCGPPGPPLILPPAIPLSLSPKKHHSIAQTRVLAVLAYDF